MKEINITLIAILLSISFCSAQNTTNNQGEIYIATGTNLTLTGDFENLANGYIANNGDLDIMGDWQNNSSTNVMLNGYSGDVNFNGSSNQTIGGSAETDFTNLNIQNNVELGNSIYVWGDLNLSAGKLNLSGYDLNYNSFSSIIADENNYIVANGNGKLNYFVDAMMPSNIPIGTPSSYTPLFISLNGFSDNYSFNIIEDVLKNGNSGNSIPDIDDCVNLTWNVEPQNPGTADYNIGLQWNAGNEMANFNRSQSAIGDYHSGQWNPNTASAAEGSGPYTHSLNNITHTGHFAIGDLESPMAITLDLIVDLTALLEGPYDGFEMLTLLNDDGLMPLNQPYNTSPWNYAGTESVAAIPNQQVVDWVLVEIRDAASAEWAVGATAIESQAAFVLTDGSIVGMDGSSNLQFTGPVAQNMFVVVYHRNHLSVMSANPVTQTGGICSYNFTTGTNQAYADGQPGQKEIATGLWGLYGGNGSGGRFVTDFDNQSI